jgi:hypothetical protein
MLRALKIAGRVIWVIWSIAALALGTAVGALYGWTHHGWPGAIVLGIIGCGVGALVAGSPLLMLEILQ